MANNDPSETGGTSSRKGIVTMYSPADKTTLCVSRCTSWRSCNCKWYTDMTRGMNCDCSDANSKKLCEVQTKRPKTSWWRWTESNRIIRTTLGLLLHFLKSHKYWLNEADSRTYSKTYILKCFIESVLKKQRTLRNKLFSSSLILVSLLNKQRFFKWKRNEPQDIHANWTI